MRIGGNGSRFERTGPYSLGRAISELPTVSSKFAEVGHGVTWDLTDVPESLRRFASRWFKGGSRQTFHLVRLGPLLREGKVRPGEVEKALKVLIRRNRAARPWSLLYAGDWV